MSLPLLDGRLPMYPVSAQFSINDLSMAPAAASGDDEPDDMALKRRGKVGSDGLQICTMPTRANREKSAAVSGEEDAEKAETPRQRNERPSPET